MNKATDLAKHARSDNRQQHAGNACDGAKLLARNQFSAANRRDEVDRIAYIRNGTYNGTENSWGQFSVKPLELGPTFRRTFVAPKIGVCGHRDRLGLKDRSRNTRNDSMTAGSSSRA